jgi:hypothetical protein
MSLGETEQAERKDYKQTKISFQGQVNYIHTLKKNYTILIGLQYQQLESQLDWSLDLEDYTITLTDTIVEVHTSLISGKEKVIRGDVDLVVPAKRMVRHHNQIRLIQIPFAVGKTWVSKKWQMDLLVGGSLNVLSKNKGRTLFENEIRDYNGSDTGFFKNQWTVNAMLSGRLTYHLNQHWGLSSGLQFQKSLSNWSTEENVTMRPSVLLLDVGLSYTW